MSAHYEAGEVGKATRARRETERAAGKEERQATKDAAGAASAASALLPGAAGGWLKISLKVYHVKAPFWLIITFAFLG